MCSHAKARRTRSEALCASLSAPASARHWTLEAAGAADAACGWKLLLHCLPHATPPRRPAQQPAASPRSRAVRQRGCAGTGPCGCPCRTCLLPCKSPEAVCGHWLWGTFSGASLPERQRSTLPPRPPRSRRPASRTSSASAPAQALGLEQALGLML